MAFPTPKRITELDLASPLTDADQIAVVQGTRTKRATIAQVKTSTDTSCQCTLVSRYNTVGTDANTLEKFFQTYQLPADTLSTDGSWLEIFAWGSTAANGNLKTLTARFGGSTIYTNSVALNNRKWDFTAKVIRTSSLGQITFAFSSTFNSSSGQEAAPTEDMGNDIAVSISGTNGTASASDITCEGFIIRVNYMDANS